jgi:hypothetical protein
MGWSDYGESDSDGYDSDADSVASHFDDNETFGLADPEAAYDYVKGVLDKASDKQISALVAVYLRPRRPKYLVKYPGVQHGGNTTGPIDVIDGKLYRFLEFVDSAHDFVDPKNASYMVPLLLQVLQLDPDTDFPYVIGADGSKDRLTVQDVIVHQTLLDKLTVSPSLYFGDDTVGIECPLAGKDYRRTVFKKPSVEGVDFEDSAQKDAYIIKLTTAYDDHCKQIFDRTMDVQVANDCSCRTVFHVDDSSNDDRVDEINQICELCVEMRHMFGTKTAFVVDTNKPMGTLLLSYKNIDTATQKVLKDLVPRLKDLVPQAWEMLECDACRADGASHMGVLHEKATGQVFHNESLVKVEFKGCEGKGYKYVATSGVVSDTSRGFEEIGLEKVVQKGKSKGFNILEMYSVNRVLAELDRCLIRSPEGRVSGVKPVDQTQWTARWLAMKRAGDWGQIEHCKNNGCAFVTHDKVAFTFAVVRDVPSLLLIDDAQLKGGCGRVIYSYVMYAKPATAQKLRSVDDILNDYKQTGPWSRSSPSWLSCRSSHKGQLAHASHMDPPMNVNRRLAIAANVSLAFPRPARAADPAVQKAGAKVEARFDAVVYDMEDVMADLDAVKTKVGEMDLSISLLVIQVTLTGLFAAFYRR